MVKTRLETERPDKKHDLMLAAVKLRESITRVDTKGLLMSMAPEGALQSLRNCLKKGLKKKTHTHYIFFCES